MKRNLKVGEVTSLKTPEDPTSSYFSFAFRTLQTMGKHSNQVSTMFDRQDAIMVCIASFLSLESTINRLYYDIFICSDNNKREVRNNIPSTHVEYIKSNWRRLSIKDKFLLLPPILSDFHFVENSKVFRLFVEFINFRNYLVHTKITESTFELEVDNIEENSWGGTVRNIEHDNNSNFKLSGFSFIHSNISREDAEKAFEITYYLLSILSKHVFTPPPYVVYVTDSNPLQFLSEDKLEIYLKSHFKHVFQDFDSSSQ
ncbi:hypothetical protein ACFW1P_02590 [Paenibacillus sp. NPDC058910]|uniref:hypothetical protein n=1 Tax=unclassified Paenibacillus TaxID=185978 RepID=UPI00369D94E1